MWNRKRRRIEELERQLKAAIEDQVTVRVGLPEPVAYTLKGLPKGLWYRVSFMFRVSDTGTRGLVTEYSDTFVGAEPPAYFDGDIGEMGADSPRAGWSGRGPDGTIWRQSDVEG